MSWRDIVTPELIALVVAVLVQPICICVQRASDNKLKTTELEVQKDRFSLEYKATVFRRFASLYGSKTVYENRISTHDLSAAAYEAAFVCGDPQTTEKLFEFVKLIETQSYQRDKMDALFKECIMLLNKSLKTAEEEKGLLPKLRKFLRRSLRRHCSR